MDRRSFFTFLGGIALGSRIPVTLRPVTLKPKRLVSYPIPRYMIPRHPDIFIDEFYTYSIQKKLGSVKFLTLDTMLGIC